MAERGARGRLTIFFGAGDAIREAARRALDEHRDGVVAAVDEQLDALLARKPDVALVDELARANPPGSRHAKRWQDVEELLDAGIDVVTTLNVQQLESLSDTVAQITGAATRETVPDSVFDKADEVRLVDSPVEGDLLALRELALRRTAERVEAKLRRYKAAHGIDRTWHTGERVLVCISPSPHSARLARAAKRMAASLHAELVAVYVETPAAIRLGAQDRERLAAHMRLVESLGGEAVTLRAEEAPEEIVRYARERDVTKIVAGKPTHTRWRDVVRPPFLDTLVRASEEIDVYVISGLEPETSPRTRAAERPRAPAIGYAAALGVVVASTGLGVAFARRQTADVVMMFLLGVVLVAMRFGYGPSLLATVLSVVAFDLFFVTPYYSFAVADLRHIVTFAVMFIVAVVISNLTQRIRLQADAARSRERRTAALLAVSRELGAVAAKDALGSIALSHVRNVFAAQVALLLPNSGVLDVAIADFDLDEKDRAAADWVWAHERAAGATTDTLASSRALFVPLLGSHERVGVLAIVPSPESHLADPDERQLLDTIARLIASALERAELAEEARRARLRVETEQLRNALLSSVSHDLRTPLAVITGVASALLDVNAPKDEAKRRELLETAHDESLRLNRLVRNLLDMTRLEAGALEVKKEAQPIEEVVGAALGRMEDRLAGRDVQTDIPADLPLVPFDSVLIEQVLINLLENATKYTPAGSPIRVAARAVAGGVEVEVSDRGPGIAAADVERVFEKFYRAREREGGGVGLGLTICRGIVDAHGGRIWVEPREGGGATFRFVLPEAS